MNSQETKNWWSKESEAFARVMDAMEKGTAKLEQVVDGYDESNQPIMRLAMVAPSGGSGASYGRLFLEPTGQENVYKFNTRNQVAGGTISGVIAANPETGKYLPVADYSKQIQYTPGSSGGFFKNVLNDIGPIGNIALALATGGTSIPTQLAAQAALNMAKGQDFGDALKGAALAVGGSQLAQGVMGGGGAPVSGMDLAGDMGAGNTLADVGNALRAGAPAAAGIEALTPELNIGTAAPAPSGGVADLLKDVSTAPVSTGAVTETPLPSATPAPAATPGGIENLTPELNVGQAQPAPSGGVADLINGPAPTQITPSATGPTMPTAAQEADALDQWMKDYAANNPQPQPVSTGISGGEAMPAQPVSGMDLAADGTPGNTIGEAGGAFTPVSGMDLAADKTPGNTIEEAGKVAGTPGGLTADANQSQAEVNRLKAQDVNATGVPVGEATGLTGLLNKVADATGLPIGVVNSLAAGLGVKAAGAILSPDQAPGGAPTGGGPVAGFQLGANYEPYTYKPFAAGGVATGGISDLGGYSDGGRLLRGPGDGVSDSIPAMIGGKQPARLADGEFVVPARIVSELGNGSTEAGARQLYAMMDRIQAARRKTTGKEQVAKNTKASKHLPA